MEQLRNNDVRQAAKNAGVRLWEVAQSMGVSDMFITRLLRKTLSAEQRSALLTTIEKIRIMHENGGEWVSLSSGSVAGGESNEA